MIPIEIWTRIFEKIPPRDRLEYLFLSKRVHNGILETFSGDDLAILDQANFHKDCKLDRQVKNNFLRGLLR